MAGKLDGKVCIITGGSLGIGSGTAKECAREGGRVAILDIHVEGGERTVAAIRESGGTAIFIGTDVSQAAEVESAVKRVIGEYGKIDVLVNAAALQVQAPVLPEVTEEEWDTVLDINLKGPFLCCKYVIPEMLKMRWRGDSERLLVGGAAGERVFAAVRSKQGGYDPAYKDYEQPVLR